MSTLALPNTIINGAAGDASKVQANFDAIVADSNTNLIKKDGVTQMTGQLLLLASNPTLGDHATRKTYTDAQDAIVAATVAAEAATRLAADTAKDARTGAGVTRIAAQTISTGAAATLLFDTEDWDPQGGFTATSGNVTINTTGLYNITWFVYCAGTTAGSLGADLFINGVRRCSAGTAFDYLGTGDGANGAFQLPLASGAILSVQIFHASGSNRNFTGGLAAVRLSA